MKYFLVVTIILSFMASSTHAQENVSEEAGIILKKAHELSDLGKVRDALTLLDESLRKFTERNFDRYSLLNYKYDLLVRESRFQEAVVVCVEKANIVTSPRQALLTAQAFLKINDIEKALEWLEISVNRGLQNYSVFEDEVYAPLRGNPRFEALADRVKKKNGIGLAAKAFMSQTISGATVSLEHYKGKVLLLEFWATWCPPCRTEMPGIIKLYSEFRNRGFEIVGFANEEYGDTLSEYLATNKIDWPIVTIDRGTYTATAAAYNVTNIPASFLIDKNGIVRHVNLTGTKLEHAIDELLKD